MVIGFKMDVQTTAVNRILAYQTSEVLLPAKYICCWDLNSSGLLCVRIKSGLWRQTVGLSNNAVKAINSRWGTDKEIHQTMMSKKSINKIKSKQRNSQKWWEASVVIFLSVNCHTSTALCDWQGLVLKMIAYPIKKSKLPAQYCLNVSVYSALTKTREWNIASKSGVFIAKSLKNWNWMIPSYLDKHHHHSVVAGEACEKCLLVTWASALPAISLIYVAPWCFKC